MEQCEGGGYLGGSGSLRKLGMGMKEKMKREGDNLFNFSVLLLPIGQSFNFAASYWPLLFLLSAAFSMRVLVGTKIKSDTNLYSACHMSGAILNTD